MNQTQKGSDFSLFMGKKMFKIFIIIMTILETGRFGVNLPLSRDVTK
jgi:hypothetical protein